MHNDQALCSNETSNTLVICNKNDTMGESVLNMTANETQTNEGYLIVGMASSNKSNAS